jgi:hypothetical protein
MITAVESETRGLHELLLPFLGRLDPLPAPVARQPQLLRTRGTRHVGDELE